MRYNKLKIRDYGDLLSVDFDDAAIVEKFNSVLGLGLLLENRRLQVQFENIRVIENFEDKPRQARLKLYMERETYRHLCERGLIIPQDYTIEVHVG